VSNLIDEFDSNFEGEGGIRHAIIDIIESRRAEIPVERMVEEETLFQVANRALETYASLDDDVRYFNALREVTNFITFATEGAISETIVKHADLLPIAHPASEAETVLTASAVRVLRGQWIAADTRIVNEDARAIVAAVYSSNPLSIDYAYNIARLESLSEGQVPADLLIIPLIAFGDPYAGKNSRWHRSMRAEGQRRDDEGQFAEMGGGYRFYVRNINGQIMSVVGKVVGIPENDPEGIDIEVTGVKGIRDGIYTIPSRFGHSFKAILPEHAVAKSVRTALKDVPFVDIKDMVRKELPTSWFGTKTQAEVAGIASVKASRNFVTGDGYRASLFKKASDDLAARIAEAQDRFGSLVISDQGTDTLNPDKPVYELISTKRGQPEIVGYAQDWAGIQKLASGEDESYPEAENEPVEESKAEIEAPVEPEEVVAEPADVEESDDETEEDDTFDPEATMPAGWINNGDGTYTTEDSAFTAAFGDAVDFTASDLDFDPRTGDVTNRPVPAAIGNAFTVYDMAWGAKVGIAFDWDGVERLAEASQMHEFVEQMASPTSIDINELLPGRSALVDPGKLADSADAKNPITSKMKDALFLAFNNHEVTDEMVDMYDELVTNWDSFDTANAKAFLIALNKQPKLPSYRKMAQAWARNIIRKQLKYRDIPKDQLDEVAANYRQFDKDLAQLTIDILNTLPMKGGDKPAPKVEEGEEAPRAFTSNNNPVSEAKINVMKAAFANHLVTPEMVKQFDDMLLNQQKYSNADVQEFINVLNGLEKGKNNLASSKQRAHLLNLAGRESTTDVQRAQVMEEYLGYTYEEADEFIKELTPPAGMEIIYGSKKNADEIAREHGLESATPEYLGTDILQGKNPPSNKQLVMLEALLENRDFSSKSATEDRETFMKHHRTLAWDVVQDYIDTFKELPFKEGFQPRQLETNLAADQGAPSPRMLRSLERKYAKGLISDELWEEIRREVPNMTSGAVSTTYIKELDDLETLHDDAILRKSIEGGFEIAGLRVPKKSTVEIPEDYTPSKAGQWIAPREEEIDAIINGNGGTPVVSDITLDPEVVAAANDAKTSGEAEAILDKAEYDDYLQREALRADLKRARAALVDAISQIADSMAKSKKVLRADARKILQNAMTDLTALKAVMDLRRKNIPSPKEFDRRLTLIAQSLLPLGDDSVSPYGELKNRTPEILRILGDAQATVARSIGIYSAGRFQYQEMEFVEEMSTDPAGKPYMKFFYPPTFLGEALEPLRGTSNFDEVVEFLKNNDFYVLDLETTGLVDLDDQDVKNDPIQVAVTKVSGLEIVDQFSTYINPESKISSYTLKGVGDGRGGKVTPEFLEAFPNKRDAMKQLIDFIPQGAIVAGHNSTLFDMEVINRAIAEAGLQPLSPAGMIDTLGMARYLMPEWTPTNPDAPFKINAYGQQTKSFSLESLVTYFGLSNNGRHEADADVASTVQVLQKMLDRGQRGLGVQGREFDFELAGNGWNQEAYEAAQEVYKEQVGRYLYARVSDLLSLEGYSPEEINKVINDILSTVSGSVDSAQGTNREVVTIPKPNTLRDLHAGSYVFDTNDGRVGFSLGIVGDNVLVDMPAADILASGKYVLEKILPERLANVLDRFLGKNGVLLDYGMEVSAPGIPGGYGRIRNLTGDDKNVVVGVGDFLEPFAARDLLAIEASSGSAASVKQESIIVNLVDELVSNGVLDRALANAFQKAADGHFYTEEAANKVIMRLTTAAQQQRQLEANDDITLPSGGNAAPSAVIEEMATKKKAQDTKTVKDIDKTELKKVLNKLPMKPTKEGEDIIAAITMGWDVVIKALAGVGKTTTLRIAAYVLSKIAPAKKILYLVFNKENQVEAEEKMPGNTESRTSDSISFNADVNKGLKTKFISIPEQMLSKNYPVNPRNTEALVDLFSVQSTTFSGDRKITKHTLARFAYQVMSEFVKSADASISKKHVKALQDEMGGLAPSDDADYTKILKLAQMMWKNILSDYDPDRSQIIVDHEHMFKNWALTNPNLVEVKEDGKSPHGLAEIPNILFLDEAQDINPVFLDLIQKQKSLHNNGLQIVAVGDTNQQIFEFRGTTDSLGVLERDITLPLTQSFRTGDGILQHANKLLRVLGEDLQLAGRKGDGSTVVESGSMTDPDLLITRTNLGILQAGLWSEIIHPKERVATTAAFKQRLTVLVDTLRWLRFGGKPENKPKQIARELIGFPTWDSLENSVKEGGDPYVKMVLNMVYSTQKRIRALKLSEALDELARVVRNFRVHNDNFSVPAQVGTQGDLGGNLSYERIKDKIVVSDTGYMPFKKVGFGVRDNQTALEDMGFTRTERINEKGFQMWEWEAQVKGDLKKQLTALVSALRGEDAIMRIMTAHTVKGLEGDRVKIWTDFKQPEPLTASELRLFYVALTRPRDVLDAGSLEWIINMDETDAVVVEEMATPSKSRPSKNYQSKFDAMLEHYQKGLKSSQEQLRLPLFKREYNRSNAELKSEINSLKNLIRDLKADPNQFERNDQNLLAKLERLIPALKENAKNGLQSPPSPEDAEILDRLVNKEFDRAFRNNDPGFRNGIRIRAAQVTADRLKIKLGDQDALFYIEEMATPSGDNVGESDDVIIPAEGLEGSDSKPVDEPKASGIRARNQEVTDRIVGEILEQMEKGMVPWRKPWSTTGVLPTSGATGRVYRGLNLLFLNMEMQRRGYQGNRFYTQNAINKLGGFLKDDAQPSIITKVTIIKTEKEQDVRKPDPDRPGFFIVVKEKVQGKIPRLDYDVVYNEDEIQGVELPGAKKMEPMEPSDIEKIVLASYANGPEIKFVPGDSAHWNPATDTINLPRRDQFTSEADFLDTLFHELTHSTGHGSRLDRKDLLDGYGQHKDIRAREELIAEIGGSIISQMFNLDAAFDNSLSYIQGWSTFLKEEPNALFEAASLASKAVEHILGGYWASEDGLVDLSEEASYTPTEAIDMPQGDITGETGTMGGLGSGVNYRIEGDSIILMGNTKGNKDAIKSVSFLPEGGKRPYKFLFHSKNGHWFTTFTGEFAIPNRVGMLNELKKALDGQTEVVEEMSTPGSESASPELKAKLYDIVDEAAKFYNNRMLNFSDATEAVKYFRGRGFSKQDAENFQLGYAPKTWATLYQHLKKKGFTDDEVLTSGLVKRSERTGRLFDALRDRIVFPIKEADGRVVGFTGRAVSPDEDIRYMLTSNTPIYQKSEVLFGLDQAKDEIAKTGEMIVVEGQFDVLAMHAAGIKNAVAASGTTFKDSHVQLFEGIAGDKKKSIIFSFDPDFAGTKAAERTYEMLRNSGIELYAVSGESDMDPSDIYSKDNEEGLKTLIDNKMPMLEYLIERILATSNISTVEGRFAATKAIASLLRGVKDKGVLANLVSKYAPRLGRTDEALMDFVTKNL
jgi:DNA primase catalytic core